MKFSLFFELQLADSRVDLEAHLFHEVIEQIVLADKLGYHCAWAVEHHGLFRYSHCSAPEVLLAYAAAKTRDIRLGHGVTLLPFRYNHPIRVAERLATLDILSEGRLNWGTGKSSSRAEQAAFQVDPATLGDEWDESLRMILKMWQSEIFEYSSPAFQIPPTRIVPKPVQKPHPPIFMAATQLASVELAARMGLGTLNFSFGSEAELSQKVSRYRELQAAPNATPVTAFATNHFACAPAALVLADDKKACSHGFRGARYFGDALHHYYYSKAWRPGMEPLVRADALSADELALAVQRRNSKQDDYNVLCGDPSYAREYVSRFRALGVDELILVMQMGTIPGELVLESVRTFGEQVLPYFA